MVNSYCLHLVPFDKQNTSYKCDFTVEVRTESGHLYATFGGSYREDKKVFLTRCAKSLNTINACPITKVTKDPSLKSISLPLKQLQKLMDTGISYNITKLETKPKEKPKLTKKEKPAKKRRRFIF